MTEHAVRSLGFGLGLRPQHYPAILDGTPPEVARGVDWFEILSENYMVEGGRPLAKLMAIRERFPMVMHGVSLSIGSTDPINMDYLARLKALAARVEPAIISDHLCWTGVAGLNMHDLEQLATTLAWDGRRFVWQDADFRSAWVELDKPPRAPLAKQILRGVMQAMSQPVARSA